MPKIVKDEAVFNSVIKLIGLSGYQGATTKKIAKSANISEVTLFRRFGSKTQLVKQSISYAVKNSHFSKLPDYSGDVKKDLTNIVLVYQKSAIKFGYFFFHIFLEISHNPNLKELLQEPLTYFTHFSKIISKYQNTGVLKKELPFRTILSLLGSILYSVILKNIIPDETLPSIEIGSYVDFYLQGRLVKN